MSDLLVAACGALAVLFLFLAASGDAGRRRERRRIERYLIAPRAVQRARVPASAALAGVLRTIGLPVVSAAGASEEHALRVGAALVGAVAGAVLAFGLGSGWDVGLGLIVVGGAIGAALPGSARSRAERGRQRAIQRALPGTLDLLALCAEAGLTFDAAVAQVVARRDDAFSAELKRFLVEAQVGRDRREALDALARRTGVPEVRRFTDAVTQADTLGVPLARVLAEQAEDGRAFRRRRAEEAARTAPVKMLFPMVLLIFPALFVVILGPAVPRLASALTLAP